MLSEEVDYVVWFRTASLSVSPVVYTVKRLNPAVQRSLETIIDCLAHVGYHVARRASHNANLKKSTQRSDMRVRQTTQLCCISAIVIS